MPLIHSEAPEMEAMRQFLNAAPVGLMQINGLGEIELINAATASLLMPALHRVQQVQLSNLFVALAPWAPQLAAQVANFRAAHGSVVKGLHLELPSQPSGDAVQHLELSVEKLGEDRYFATLTDLTLQRQAEAAQRRVLELQLENRQLLQVSRMKNRFVATMSHELRTPLHAVIGFADLLRSGTVSADSPEHGDFVTQIATSGRHLLHLIDDVLDLSKLEAGKLEFFPEAAHLPVLVQEVLDVLRPIALGKQLPVEVEIAPDLGELFIDPARLKHVLFNYLSNAIKFTPAGGQVRVRACAEGAAQFRLEVHDTGIGIKAQDLPRLFVDFQQLESDRNRRYEGTGVGLALTRRLVEAQGGSVGVTSQPGVRTVFHAVLNRRHAVPVTDSMPAARLSGR